MEEDKDKMLESSKINLQCSRLSLIESIKVRNIEEILKHSVSIISELTSSSLSPKAYYELFMQVFDVLSQVHSFLLGPHENPLTLVELFEKVQHVASILPRLYLLIAVGSACIIKSEVSAKEMLKDLIEMVKGIQHPMRGLFLRYYLNKMSKDKLPDAFSGASFEDLLVSIEFILNNFSEMCRLWVRIQHAGGISDKIKREQERHDLKVTIGENIVRLSALEGVTLEIYLKYILNKVLEVILVSKDPIAQQYLIDCVIQAFPGNFHLNSLSEILENCALLDSSVDIKPIFVNLLTKIADYTEEKDLEVLNHANCFEVIFKYLEIFFDKYQSTNELASYLVVLSAFFRFSSRLYPKNIQKSNKIVDLVEKFVEKDDSAHHLDVGSRNCLEEILLISIEALVLDVISLAKFSKILSYLPYTSRKKIALRLIKSVISHKIILNSQNVVHSLLELTISLFINCTDMVESDTFSFEQEQEYVSRLVHLVKGQDLKEHLQILFIFAEKFKKGEILRQKFTLPSLIFALIKFLYLAQDSEIDKHGVIKILFILILKISKNYPEIGYKLSLECVQCLNNIDKTHEFQEIAYEFAVNSLVVFQDNLQDLDLRFLAINLISAHFTHLTCFEQENAYTLLSNCAQFASKTLRKSESFEGNLIASKIYSENKSAIYESSKFFIHLEKSIMLARISAEKNEDYSQIVKAFYWILYLKGKNRKDISEKIFGHFKFLYDSNHESLNLIRKTCKNFSSFSSFN